MAFRTATVLNRLAFRSFVVDRGCVRHLSSTFSPKLPDEVDFRRFEDARKRGDALLVDVREPVELKEIGSVPGAINVPLGEVESAFAPTNSREFEAKYTHPQPQKSDAVMVFCMIGKRSAAAKEILEKAHGYQNVANYVGSFQEWADKAK